MNIESEYALQMMMLGGSGASRFNYTLRNIISFDGVNQYGTLATPWAPGGQGRITLQIKIPDTATNRFLVDGVDSGVGRLLVLIDTADNISAGGLSVTIDGVSTLAFPADNLVHEITISGDMTGLSVEKIFRNYNGSFYTAGNILYAKFEDLSTTVAGTNDLEFDFSSGVSTEAPINEGASNLITYQNYSADQWATYIQQPNGDWKGKVAEPATSISNPSLIIQTNTNDFLWTRESYAYVEYASVIAGEAYQISWYLPESTGADGKFSDNGTGFPIVIPANQPAGAGSNEFTLQADGLTLYATTYGVGVTDIQINNLTINHLIKLSTAQQNQFYIDQTEAAINGYKAKHTSGYVTTLDGVDDNVALDTPWTPTVSGSFEVSALVNTTSEAEIVSSDTLSTDGIYIDITAGSVRAFAYVAGVIQGLIQTAATTFADGKTHSVKLVHPANGFAELWVDGVLEDTAGVAWALNGNQYVSVIGHRDTSTYTSGYIREVSCIDHESPLPIGQGGNSGFWPLDDADDIARNVLGLDGNGNVIARTGATLDGFGTWNGSPSRELFSLDVATGSLENSSWPNLLKWSEDLTNAVWSKQGVSVVPNTVLAPDNTLSADKVVESALNEEHEVHQIIDIPAGANSYSFYAKAAEISEVTTRRLNTTLDNDIVTFDLLTGGVTVVSGTGGGYTEEVSNGFYKCTVTLNSPAGGSGALRLYLGSGIAAYFGDGSSGLYLWGAQQSLGSISETYSKTTDTAGIELELSTELQRLYDLSIVEAKIAKIDAQFSRVQPLLDLDGVDDSASASTWVGTANWDFITNIVPSSASLQGLISKSGGTAVFIRLTNITTTPVMSIKLGGVEKFIGFASAIQPDIFYELRLEKRGTTISLFLDDVYEGSNSDVAWDTSISLDTFFALGTLTQLLSGYSGAFQLIDYTNPTNSRYYMPTATGLVDLLGTGSTDGTYNGSPAAPELFYRVGDNWQNADASTIIPGA